MCRKIRERDLKVGGITFDFNVWTNESILEETFFYNYFVEREEVFTVLETRLDSIAKEQGELRMTVPMLYLQAEK